MEGSPSNLAHPALVAYNPIFEQLVIDTPEASKERLIGMLAYADYKLEKYYWKSEYRQHHDSVTVPQQAVADFLLAYNDGRLDKLKNDADDFLSTFAESYAEERAAQAYQQGLAQQDGWWKTGLKSAFGSLLFAALVITLSIIFTIAQPQTNYARLVQYVIGGQDFVVLPTNDCRLTGQKPCSLPASTR